ncbi:Cof-type HAD-IIB family hydrolase [Virgibacillus alimentarius]|uniref:HAD superfamily hydrolase (TIGR01484 family) n=1 Tax=Virgibacillus alimentarius TaxID=698769 RepID=A0ABS4S5K1_9BACI|nr:MULTISPECIES: Cof-type HAD-IIB family hydrolase [Virgibacillus]MBP2256769.1 HAD superfamily hydrolase (TIGR01484 family) [Virgibacillus alimentarius]HLR65638.1 Cof-type HAD-IIB family hydrolase [Virgibacillus sp.]
MTDKKQAIKLIALDMDGTLLTSDGEITTVTREAIANALEQNIHVVLSTGRWFGNCYPFAESLNLTSYLVTANGGEIWTVNKKLIERHLLDPAMMEKMWGLASFYGLNTWIVSTEKVYYNGERPEDFYAHEWLKFGCDAMDKRKLDKVIEAFSYYDALELTNSLPTNIEVNPLGVNKATALERITQEIGITMDNVLAAGDSLNDIKMIQQAGIGVAMGNAQEAIKKAAAYVTDTNDQDGVAKAIKRFAL